MDKDTVARISEAASALSTSAFRIQMDTTRDALERVPEDQR